MPEPERLASVTVVTSDGDIYPLAHCRSCGARIYWGKTRRGKTCPFDVWLMDSGDLVGSYQSHFRTCQQAAAWTKRQPARKAS